MKTINIADMKSTAICSVMRKIGVTQARFIGGGEWEEGNINSHCSFFAFTDPLTGFEFRVADTNGAPLWEDEGYGDFYELAESCGVDL